MMGTWTVCALLVMELTWSVRAALDCYKGSNVQELQKTCFTTEGVNITLPEYASYDSKETRKKHYVEVLVAQGPDQLCRQKEAYKRGLVCAMQQTINCMPTEYQGYLPKPSNMAGVVARLCDNDSNIDFQCVKSKAEALFECADRKGKETFSYGTESKSVENVLCKAFLFNAECQRSELQSCGCHTAFIYESMARELLYPPGCPKIDPAHVCNDSHSISYSSSKRELQFLSVLIVLCLLFFFKV